ncbi:ribosome biogenesis GTP-binding protein YsxC [Candidatus Uhrbacteria bacterium]|nr:ribosome biogenesis GTP-binding protein YsxC [Candidatus Uhrbacteria bacterium]
MRITSATFVKGVVGTNEIFEDGTPQIALIGRSNVGKSSVINSLVHMKNLARVSSSPGRTQQINLYLINRSFYLVDLPGYGFARAPRDVREQIQKMIYWYLFTSGYVQKKVVLIIDANVGLTADDLATLQRLDEEKKNVVILANKVDKLKQSKYIAQLQSIQDSVGAHLVIPYSAKKGTGVGALTSAITISR